MGFVVVERVREKKTNICLWVKRNVHKNEACLKALSQGQVAGLVYDSNTNFGATVCIFDKGQFPICGMAGLSPFLKKVVGFNVTTLAFTSEALQDGNKFNPVVQLLQQTGDFDSKKKEESAQVEPKAKRLKRNKEASNEFPPKASNREGNFGDDFIKFS